MSVCHQALLMMTMYSFRAAEAPSVWFLSGIIVRNYFSSVSNSGQAKLMKLRCRSACAVLSGFTVVYLQLDRDG